MSATDLKPYFSVIVGKGLVPIVGVVRRIWELLESQVAGLTKGLPSSEIDSAGVRFATLFYTEEATPSWCALNPHRYVDHLNHYFTVASYCGDFILQFSDQKHRDLCAAAMLGGRSGLPAPFDAEELNHIFLADQPLRTLWLYGIHRKSSIKADSKTVFGQDLVDAIDAIGDQSYAFSAARSRLPVGARERTVGVSPEKSFIWIGPTEDWTQYKSVVRDVFQTLSARAGKTSAPIPTLCVPVKDLGDADVAFDLDVADPEELPGVAVSSDLSRLLSEVAQNYAFDIHPGLRGPSSFLLRVSEVSNHLKSFIGEVSVLPVVAAKKVSFQVDALNIQPGKTKTLSKFCRVFKRPDILKVWYESGHVLTDGRAFLLQYSDVQFEGHHWSDFRGYDVTKEKPLNRAGSLDLSLIGASDSLFCWLKNRWTAIATEIDPNFVSRRSWQYCDDGAGEIADFINVDDCGTFTLVTLVHIKAAGAATGTQISVGAHEIVLAQAIKNLRALDQATLITAVERNLAANKYVWDAAARSNVPNLLAYLRGLGGQFRFRVIVVQPHTRRTYYEATTHSKQRKQLDALLWNARNVIGSVGSEFIIMGNDV